MAKKLKKKQNLKNLKIEKQNTAYNLKGRAIANVTLRVLFVFLFFNYYQIIFQSSHS